MCTGILSRKGAVLTRRTCPKEDQAVRGVFLTKKKPSVTLEQKQPQMREQGCALRVILYPGKLQITRWGVIAPIGAQASCSDLAVNMV